MSPDARELLRDAAAEPALPLDIERAWRRGRRLRWGRRAAAMVAVGAVAVATWAVVASDGLFSESVGRDPRPAGRDGSAVDGREQRRPVRIGGARAATLAIRAAVEERLLDANGTYWDYEGVQPVGGRWVARFRGECTRWSTACTERAGALTVEVVRFPAAPPTYSIAAPGAETGPRVQVPEDPAIDVPAELVYRVNEVIEWRGDKLLWATPVWTGPIPATGGKARCQAILNRSDGTTVFLRPWAPALDQAGELPTSEDERSGTPFVLEVGRSVVSGVIGC
jgi:hypothetical protein